MSGLFVRCVSALPQQLRPWTPFAPARDRTCWENVLPAYAHGAVDRARTQLTLADAPLTLGAYLQYSRTGDRAGYETPYLQRRRRLCDLVMGECIEHEGRFTDSIADVVFALCEESSWCFPAHLQSCSKNGSALTVPDPEVPSLDLFAAETGATLALTLWVLQKELAQISPVLVRRMEQELYKRVVVPYSTYSLHWMRLSSAKEHVVSNWTPWCTMNSLIVLFTLAALPGTRITDEELHGALCKAAVGMDAYFDSTGDDGCCKEGLRYYRHGVLSFYTATVLMDTVTGGALQPVRQSEKFRRMASYAFAMHIGGEYYCNFCDCPQRPGPGSAAEFLFAREAGDEAMEIDCAKEIVRSGYSVRTSAAQNLFWHLQLAFCAADAAQASRRAALAGENRFYPSTGIWVCRAAQTYVAVKGGNNAEPHNHNDIGSITLFMGGQPVLVDVGVGSYSKETFGPDRYSIWSMGSGHHNVLNFGQTEQAGGADYYGQVLSVCLQPPEITMELAKAYPAKAGMESYVRRVRLLETGSVEITDTVDALPPGTYLSLMTAVQPQLFPADAALQVGNAKISVSGADEIAVQEIPLTDAVLQQGWQVSALYRIQLTLQKNTLRLQIENTGKG